MRNTKIFILGMAVMPLALLGIAVALASSVATPNTFTAGTPAVAAEVNANFAAHQVAINDNDTRITAAIANMPQVWSQQDQNGGGHTEAAAGQTQMNSIAITAPSNGYLIISGKTFINNGEVTDERYTIVPQIDGANVLPTPWAALIGVGPTGTDLESDTLSYTITAPITAGAHTVSQTVGPFGGTATFFHNAEDLTVTFIPTGTITTQNSP
jgi:hypothetical protein